jgi:hypothetical protein
LFKGTGFAVDDFIEVRAPERGPEVKFFASADWSNDHPSEQVWMLTRQ